MNSSQRRKRDQQFRPLSEHSGWVWPVRHQEEHQWRWHQFRRMPMQNRLERAQCFQFRKRIGQ
jgi:hypothetical protein